MNKITLKELTETEVGHKNPTARVLWGSEGSDDCERQRFGLAKGNPTEAVDWAFRWVRNPKRSIMRCQMTEKLRESSNVRETQPSSATTPYGLGKTGLDNRLFLQIGDN